MSTIKHPVGPQSSKVYWRRRLVVGLGLLFVLIIILLIIVRPGSSNGQPDGKPKAPASTASTDAPAAAATDPAAVPAKCDPAQVQVEATTDADTYEPGKMPQLSLSITNTGSAPCVINAGTAKQVFTISSGKDVYWKSTDCQTNPSDADVTLEPKVPVSSTTPVTWDRIRSSPDTCDSNSRPAASAGGASYHLAVTVDGIDAKTPKQFILD
ncbi:hypothetical protein E3O19_13760 [Cryobacterium algoritolerans]|uniref:DUF4232 domain-containing protein n=1 Tax=Cryobacterium algoritolerans TaxID=1259184 RepID=A0A4R8WKZ6_9MICO|nr:hypothetical protein [Cryobacterium algoritolerans]TFC12014.1 hypothetical protein E3O19_13760 [Cryobacterium algoritolerans]